jgi:hypothetical protein
MNIFPPNYRLSGAPEYCFVSVSSRSKCSLNCETSNSRTHIPGFTSHQKTLTFSLHDISLGHGVFVVFTDGVDVGVSEKLLGCGLVIDEICVVVVSSTIRDVSDTVADVVFDSDVACVVSGVQNEDEAGSCLVDGTMLFPRVVSLPSNVLLKTELKVIVGKYVFAKLDLFTLLTFTLFEPKEWYVN